MTDTTRTTVERVMMAVFRWLTAVLFLALMLLTCADVIGRYFFNRPVYGGLELTELFLAGVIFCALPIVTYTNEHIVVDLFTLRHRWAERVQHVAVNLLGAAALAILARQMWLRANRLDRAGETTLQLDIPMDFVAYTISVLLAVTAVAFLLRVVMPPVARQGGTAL